MPQRKQGSEPQQRMYSFTVKGWLWGGGGEKLHECQAQIVAASYGEAVEEAEALLDPETTRDHWMVAGVIELDIVPSKAWAAWHKTASSPLGRAEVETTQD